MTTEMVGPIKRSIGLGCIPHWDGRPTRHNCRANTYPDVPQDPVCICHCHGIQVNDDDTDSWYLGLVRGKPEPMPTHAELGIPYLSYHCSIEEILYPEQPEGVTTKADWHALCVDGDCECEAHGE